MPEWDSDKVAVNLRKRGVDFADAVTAGLDSLGRILVVAYTWRGDDVRMISARKATAYERRQYEKVR